MGLEQILHLRVPRRHAFVAGAAAVLVGTEAGNEPEHPMPIKSVTPIYRFEQGRLPIIQTKAVGVKDETTVPVIADALLALAPAVASSIKLNKHQGRRALLAGMAIAATGAYTVSYDPNSAQSLAARMLDHLPGKLHGRGARLVTDPLGSLLHGVVQDEQNRIKDERLNRQGTLDIGESNTQTINADYSIVRFVVEGTQAPFGRNDIFGQPRIAVGIGPVESTEELRFPTELTPHPSGVTIAADSSQFGELLREKRFILPAGAAAYEGTVAAQRITANLTAEQQAAIERRYLSAAVPYTWINAVTHMPTRNNPLTETERTFIRTVQTEAGLTEFMQTDANLALVKPVQISGGRNAQYQTQFIVNSDYSLTGSRHFAIGVDNTINLVARVTDASGQQRSLVISGQWWWNLAPTESAQLLKKIMNKLHYTLIQAYSVDTGSQTGFYYKDGHGQLQFAHDGSLDNMQHTTVGAVLV